MYRVIKKEELQNPSQYEWFNTFSNPCFGLNVKMDVTKVLEHSKRTKTKFFINVLYLVVKGLNSVDEMRMRQVGEEIRLYDIINPTFTVMTEQGFFENAGFKMIDDYKGFYAKCLEVLEETKTEEKIKDGYNDSTAYDDYYITCLPWLSYESMTHPLCNDNKESSSCPRVCWDKFREENGKTVFVLNITVSHCFVDGRRIGTVFNNIQDNFNRAEDLLK